MTRVPRHRADKHTATANAAGSAEARAPDAAAVAESDPLTDLAVERLRRAHPHERLLLLAGSTMTQYAKRLGVSRTRVADVFAQAEAYGRLSPEWAERLARSVDTTPEAIYALFGIPVPTPEPSAARRRRTA